MFTLDGMTNAVPRIGGSPLLCYSVDLTAFILYMTPSKTSFLPKRDAVSVVTFTLNFLNLTAVYIFKLHLQLEKHKCVL